MTGEDEPLFLVYSDQTGEFALPDGMGWTFNRAKAGLYTERRADRACETMLDGARCSTSMIDASNTDEAIKAINEGRE